MKMEVNLQQRLEQRMHLSQQMLQNLELLQLPIMDLRELILGELQENPTLEERQDVEEREPPGLDAPEETPEEAAKREILETVEEQWFESERRTRRSESADDAERRLEMLQNRPQAVSLRDHLNRQLVLLDLAPDARVCCEHLLEAIDDNGYLRFSLEDLAATLPEDLRAEPREILIKKLVHALSIVQTLEPRGVGARTVKECLLIQLDEANPQYPLLRRLIENHFEDVAANRLPKIAKAMSSDPETARLLGYAGEPDPNQALEDVKLLINEISRLNPKPGATYSVEKIPKVYPEVVIKEVGGKYEIVLEDGWLPPISLNRNYEEMLREQKISKEDRERVAGLLGKATLSDGERALLTDLHRGRRLTHEARDRLGRILTHGTLTKNEHDELAEVLRVRRLSREERDFIKQKMDAGRKLITAIEQRRGTIYRITNEILKHQRDFFESGIEHLKPLKMQKVADALGIHLSTVSRAISEKWVETPRGIFPLKFFFASAAPRNEQAAARLAPAGLAPDGPDEGTRLALMARIREIVDAENGQHPLSDLEIMRKLKDKHGIVAARRTIAKYREEMGIPSSRLRKKY